MNHKDTYKAYTKLKKNKQDTFHNEHTAEIILFESAKKYLKEHLFFLIVRTVAKRPKKGIPIICPKQGSSSEFLDFKSIYVL